MVVLDEYKMQEASTCWDEAQEWEDCWVLFGNSFAEIEAAVEDKDKGQLGIYRYTEQSSFVVDIPKEHYEDWPYFTIKCKCVYPLTYEEWEEIKEWK